MAKRERRCVDCRVVVDPGKIARDRCSACYQYLHRTGRTRPQWLIDRPQRPAKPARDLQQLAVRYEREALLPGKEFYDVY